MAHVGAPHTNHAGSVVLRTAVGRVADERITTGERTLADI